MVGVKVMLDELEEHVTEQPYLGYIAEIKKVVKDAPGPSKSTDEELAMAREKIVKLQDQVRVLTASLLAAKSGAVSLQCFAYAFIGFSLFFCTNFKLSRPIRTDLSASGILPASVSPNSTSRRVAASFASSFRVFLCCFNFSLTLLCFASLCSAASLS